jgi:hypothetical protein
VDYVYVWADGIQVNLRLEEHKPCLLVMIGVPIRVCSLGFRQETAPPAGRGRGSVTSKSAGQVTAPRIKIISARRGARPQLADLVK